MSNQPFMTIAGRYRKNMEISRLEGSLSKREQTLAMLMFYAGFAAALEANLEIADFEENDAIQLLAALDTEAQQLAATAAGIFAGGFTQ